MCSGRRAPAQQQVFQAALQVGVQGGADQWRAVRTVQPPRQQGRQARLQARRQQQGFLQGFVHRRLRPDLELRQALQHLVPGRLCPRGMPVRAQPARRLGQHRQQRGFGVGQVLRRLAQVSPTGRGHPLQGAAERRAVEVEREDLLLAQVPFQLRGAPQLAQLAVPGSRMRVEQARHLHRQGAAAGQHPPAREVLPGSAHQRHRVDPGMAVEPAVFIGQQRVQVIGRDFVGAHRITPDAIGIGKAPQRRAILGQHHPRQVILGQRQRPDAIGQPERGPQQQQAAQHHPQDSPATAAARLRRWQAGRLCLAGYSPPETAQARYN